MCIHTAKVSVKRYLKMVRRSFGHCNGYGQNCICPKALLVGGSVKINEQIVNVALAKCITPYKFRRNYISNVLHCIQYPLSAVARI